MNHAAQSQETSIQTRKMKTLATGLLVLFVLLINSLACGGNKAGEQMPSAMNNTTGPTSIAHEATDEAKDRYTVTLNINVSKYNIVKENGFDIIEIPDISYTMNESEPMMPYMHIEYELPSSTRDVIVEEVIRIEKNIGFLNIPSLRYNRSTYAMELTNQTNISGFYPHINYSLYVSPPINEGLCKMAYVYIILAKFNPDTGATRMLESTKINLSFEAPITLAIIDYWTDRDEYFVEEPITGNMRIKNVGAETLTGLTANLTLWNAFGHLVDFSLSEPFEILAGETINVYATLTGSYPVEISPEPYVTKMSIIGYIELGNAREYISINNSN